jgi:excinuclease ABC subunit A
VPGVQRLGVKIEIDPWKVIPDRTKSIADGAIVPWSKSIGGGRFPSMNPYYLQQVERVLRSRRVKTTTPIEKHARGPRRHDPLRQRQEAEVLVRVAQRSHLGLRSVLRGRDQQPAAALQRDLSDYVKEDIEKYMSSSTCKVCKGARLKPEALASPSTARTSTTSPRCRSKWPNGSSPRSRRPSARPNRHQILKEIRARLGFLTNVGLGYLNLSRSATTLSGGESQRIRLATQIGSSLVGVLYILDEPSIGLHQRDNDRLLATLQTLRDIGNTLIVIEHDEDTMRHADVIVDIGPGAGAEGGHILSVGPIEDILETIRNR